MANCRFVCINCGQTEWNVTFTHTWLQSYYPIQSTDEYQRKCDFKPSEYTLFGDKSVKEGLEEQRNFTSQPDDVIIATYPKSGTNWVYTIVYMLLNRTTNYPKNLNLHYHKAANAQQSPRRIFASHFPLDFLPKDTIEKGVKIINVMRNPKDTAVSFYNFMLKLKHENYSGSWDGFLDLFMEGKVLWGSWFKYVKDWQSIQRLHPSQIICFKFEDIQKDLRGQIQRIAQFLDVSYTEQFLNGVTKQCSFELMEKAKIDEDFWRNRTRDGTCPIWRKGVVGDWKNWFTVAQNEKFDEFYNIEMENHEINFKYQ